MSNSTVVTTKLTELLRTNAEIAATEKALNELRAKRKTLEQETTEALQQMPNTEAGKAYRVRANYEDWVVGYRIDALTAQRSLILVADHPQLSSL